MPTSREDRCQGTQQAFLSSSIHIETHQIISGWEILCTKLTFCSQKPPPHFVDGNLCRQLLAIVLKVKCTDRASLLPRNWLNPKYLAPAQTTTGVGEYNKPSWGDQWMIQFASHCSANRDDVFAYRVCIGHLLFISVPNVQDSVWPSLGKPLSN